jgi:hypothetical protein
MTWRPALGRTTDDGWVHTTAGLYCGREPENCGCLPTSARATRMRRTITSPTPPERPARVAGALIHALALPGTRQATSVIRNRHPTCSRPRAAQCRQLSGRGFCGTSARDMPIPDGPVSHTRPATPTTSVTPTAGARPETASMLHRCRLNSLDAPSMSFARARPGPQAPQETRQPRETPLRLPACPEPDYMLRGRSRALARVMGRAGAPSPQEPLPLRPGRHPVGNRHTRRGRGRPGLPYQ